MRDVFRKFVILCLSPLFKRGKTKDQLKMKGNFVAVASAWTSKFAENQKNKPCQQLFKLLSRALLAFFWTLCSKWQILFIICAFGVKLRLRLFLVLRMLRQVVLLDLLRLPTARK